jgi:hypothetical protein
MFVHKFQLSEEYAGENDFGKSEILTPRAEFTGPVKGARKIRLVSVQL